MCRRYLAIAWEQNMGDLRDIRLLPALGSVWFLSSQNSISLHAVHTFHVIPFPELTFEPFWSWFDSTDSAMYSSTLQWLQSNLVYFWNVCHAFLKIRKTWHTITLGPLQWRRVPPSIGICQRKSWKPILQYWEEVNRSTGLRNANTFFHRFSSRDTSSIYIGNLARDMWNLFPEDFTVDISWDLYRFFRINVTKTYLKSNSDCSSYKTYSSILRRGDRFFGLNVTWPIRTIHISITTSVTCNAVTSHPHSFIVQSDPIFYFQFQQQNTAQL